MADCTEVNMPRSIEQGKSVTFLHTNRAISQGKVHNHLYCFNGLEII